MTTVDVHAHLGIPAVDELIAGEPGVAQQRVLAAASLGLASAAYSVGQIRSLAVRLSRP